ncbi:MAG: SAM-dependent chlorinase/fluorinase [Gammaproteobacteria bacterium]|nr:SAM-dependent chlorinase/fluorinase [Gammaproteobacteria bacterium]MBT8110629.1 SAM-dependent chlorinase/fluorinase [Gammaproteobacteria bacterium]NND46758.1 SAM-dependent chlorinase/fluorinase [Woeseiaceae bacterium]NNL45329.1 SAM-dependent chlorinase/fluorinase [Woeseiaceae bacterium]
MTPSGVITITTDFGHKGPFAGVMKGVILSRFPDARIVDLAHDIPAQWPPEAGFWVSRSYSWFPAGTVHIAIVDPGVGTEREILLVEADGHVFIAPDNGLLGQLLDTCESPRVFRLLPKKTRALQLRTPSATFHGRDIFAPVAAEIAAGRISVGDIGQPISEWTPGWLDEPESAAGKVTGVIVTIDAFGNLISNIDARLIEHFSEPVAEFAGHQIAVLQTYGRARPGDLLALVNSFGVIEIAKAEGSAAEGLGSARGAPLLMRDGYTT